MNTKPIVKLDDLSQIQLIDTIICKMENKKMS